MGIRREISAEVTNLEKSAQGTWGTWAPAHTAQAANEFQNKITGAAPMKTWEDISRAGWGGIGTAAGHFKYLTDAVGNIPRLFGAKNNWWGDDFQNNSYLDYLNAGRVAGQYGASTMATGIANGATLGLSKTLNDAHEQAMAEYEGKLNGEQAGFEAEELAQKRQIARDYGVGAVEHLNAGQNSDVMDKWRNGETGVSDEVAIAGKGANHAGEAVMDSAIALATGGVGGAIGKRVAAKAGQKGLTAFGRNLAAKGIRTGFNAAAVVAPMAMSASGMNNMDNAAEYAQDDNVYGGSSASSVRNGNSSNGFSNGWSSKGWSRYANNTDSFNANRNVGKSWADFAPKKGHLGGRRLS